MRKIEKAKEWKDILDCLITIQTVAELKEMRKSIFEKRGKPQPLSAKAMVAKKEIKKSGTMSDKEALAISVYDLIGGEAYLTDRGTVVFFGFEINPDDLFDAAFVDALKLVDLISTNSMPTEIAAFERSGGYPNIVRAAKEGKVALSEPEASLIHSDGYWKVKGARNKSPDLVSALKNFNDVFYSSVNEIVDKKISQYNEFFMK